MTHKSRKTILQKINLITILSFILHGFWSSSRSCREARNWIMHFSSQINKASGCPLWKILCPKTIIQNSMKKNLHSCCIRTALTLCSDISNRHQKERPTPQTRWSFWYSPSSKEEQCWRRQSSTILLITGMTSSISSIIQIWWMRNREMNI